MKSDLERDMYIAKEAVKSYAKEIAEELKNIADRNNLDEVWVREQFDKAFKDVRRDM